MCSWSSSPPRPVSAMRFHILLAALVLMAASGALSLLLGPASYAQLRGLGQVVFVEDGLARLPLALTPDRYAALRGLLYGGFGAGLLATAALLRTRPYRQELSALVREVGAAGAGLGRTVRGLTRTERAVAGGLLALVLVLRGWVLLRYGFRHDEVLSYVAFVRPGPLAGAAFYPLPNNHVFFNLCAGALRPWLEPAAPLLMRLPSFAAAAGGTALSYALLARLAGFRLATLVTGLFNLTPAALLYAASGRGYYLQLVLLQLGFFAVVELGRGPRYRRLGWAVFVTSSVLGLYTVPTYAYPLASLLLGLGLVLGASPGQLGAHWRPLLLSAALIAAAAALLYTPVGAVSGWGRLLANPYVQPVAWAAFAARLPGSVYATTEVLFGPVRPVLLGGAALLALAPVALARTGGRGAARSLGWMAWALLVLPGALILLQRTFPPVRVLMYLAYFACLLAALALRCAAARWWPGAPRQKTALVLLAVLGAGAARLGEVGARIRSSQREEAQLGQAWRWLQGQRPRRVWLGAYPLFFYYYALRDRQPVTLADRPAPGRRYPWLVLPPAAARPPAWAAALPYRCVFRNELVSIFALPTP